MATLPSFEGMLLEVFQSLELGPLQSTTKNKFADLGYSLQTQSEKQRDFLVRMFDALEMDDHARQDAISNFLDWANFHKAVELHTSTWNADERQVLWHMLGYSYAPALGRSIAFWNLDGVFDEGMPAGRFWFLPVIDTKSGKLHLPVPQVLDWLQDLLDRPMDDVRDQLGGARTDRASNHESIERNLYNWRTGNIPSAAKIAEYFPDEAKIDFDGVFELCDHLSDEEQFTAALKFVRDNKALGAEGLRDQIPMTQPGRLEAIFDGSAAANEKQHFVSLVRKRYARPSMRTIRQRFRVARMVQDGYRRLLEFLCPDVDKCCTDPQRNKLLQISAIFKLSYNLTIAARETCDTEEEEDAWFEAQLRLLHSAELFLAVLPSNKGLAYRELASMLTRRFATLANDAPLDDLFGLDERSARPTERTIRRLQKEAADDRRYARLVERVRGSSPWRALQEEDDYWVVRRVAQNASLPTRARQTAVERMRELSTTPQQALGTITIELAMLLNARRQERPRDAQPRVAALLKRAREFPEHSQWDAPLFQYEAKHLLAQNDFEGAEKLFRKALETSSERNFGQLRGEVARDAFATEVANHKLIPGNHEKYYRNMLAYGMLEGGEPTLEDTAVGVADYFWRDLYKPYPEVERVRPVVAAEAECLIRETFPLVSDGDWDGLRGWLERHSRRFQKSLREVRGDTVLMAWLKARHALAGVRPNNEVMTPPHPDAELAKFRNVLANWNKAIALLVRSWPRQVNVADFKGQTPLMLVADAGDDTLTRVFIEAGADVNAQDYRGRTALHAAVASRSEHCVAAILASNSDVRKATIPDQQTVLHTAVRMGQPTILKMVLERDPGLRLQENADHQTPLALAEDILADLPMFQTAMAREQRRIGTPNDYDMIRSMLWTDLAKE